MRDLSVLIPARNEEWLARTIADVLEHAHADTEIIAVLDGAWANPPIPDHPRLTLIHPSVSIGQRAATNLAARASTARYVMKLDGHCSVADGFDVELIRAAGELGEDVTQIPAQYNFHIYDQVCGCGARFDQAPHFQACPTCGGALHKELVWERRERKRTTSWVFTPEPKFAYDKAGDKQQRRTGGDIHDVMTALGACFFLSRDRFWQIGGLDEAYGSWGSFGLEVACKAWLSGGRHVVNTRTYFAHFFRVGGIGFPYEIHASAQEAARTRAKAIWWANAWPGQVRPLSWLVEKFWPVPGWTDADLAVVREAGERFERERAA